MRIMRLMPIDLFVLDNFFVVDPVFKDALDSML
jgi:hypothetical protein